MIRRKAKRAAVLNKPEEGDKLSKKKKPLIDDEDIDVEKELEKLLFGEAAQHILTTRDKPYKEKLEDENSEYDSDEVSSSYSAFENMKNYFIKQMTHNFQLLGRTCQDEHRLH